VTPVAHAAHDVLVAGPASVALVALGLATWRSARRSRRDGRAAMHGDG